MKEQKVVITNSEYDINRDLSNGWRVVFQPISQHVATGDEYTTKEGKFCFVLEREEQ
jgi:hypothetical protein